MTDNNVWAQLVCISEEDGLVIPISSDAFSVGRAKACDLSMPDNKFISGRHCNLFRRNNTVWLEDTSTNGTWLNGVKIGKGQKQRLFHKDEIAVVQQQGNQGAKDIVYRYEDCAMLEAEQERLDQTQEMCDQDENTEDYVYEEVDKEEGESRKRKIDDSDASDEPAPKRIEEEAEKEVEKTEEDTGLAGKPREDAKDNQVDVTTKVSPELKSPEEDAANKEKDEDVGKGDGDVKEGGKEEKDKADGKEEGKTEKMMKGEENKSAQEEEETDDILDTLICSICQDILHRCISLQPCMHSFCAGCISGWMKHSKRCPQCRKHVKRIGHNYIVNSLVDAYLKQHPEKQRSKEDLEEMDARSNVPCNMTLDAYNPLDDDDEEGDYDPSEEEEEEEEEYYRPAPYQPPACRQCPHYVQPLNRDAVMSVQLALDASMRGAGTSGNAASTSSGNAASTSSGDGASSSTSSSPSKRVRLAVGGIPVPMPDPPQFQCDQDNIHHVACSCCLEIMPNRTSAPDVPAQKCCVCQRNYCHMYWGCKAYNCLGCLNKFKDMKFSEAILDTIINNNRYESTIFKDFMMSRGFNNVQLVLHEVLSGLAARNFSTPETQRCNITGDTPICYTCALRVFQQIAYLYRANIPKNDLPVMVTARGDCHWGKACRTQYNKPHHAANFNHVCEQIRF